MHGPRKEENDWRNVGLPSSCNASEIGITTFLVRIRNKIENSLPVQILCSIQSRMLHFSTF